MRAQTSVLADRSLRSTLGAWDTVAGGFAAAALGLLLDLPTIGSTGTSAAITIGIAALIGIGVLAVAIGMLQLRRRLDKAREVAKRGLAMQGVGWIVFLAGVLGLQISTSIWVLVLSSVFVISACALTITGGLLLRRVSADINAPNGTAIGYLVVGTAFIFIGVGAILASKIGYYFVFPDVTSIVINDVGAAVSAFGCVIAGYGSFVIRGSGRRISVQIPGGTRSPKTLQASPHG